MKLGEGLNRRADLARKLAELRRRVAVSATAQEGEEPPEDPNELLDETFGVATELQKLVTAINLTNAHTAFDDSGATITEALAWRDRLAQEQGVIEAAIQGVGQDFRYSRSEIKTVSHVNVKDLRKQADERAKTRRELDTALQEKNWTVELEPTDGNLPVV